MEILPSLLSFIDSKVRTFKKRISDTVDVAEHLDWQAANAPTSLPKEVPWEEKKQDDEYLSEMDPFRHPEIESVSELLVRKTNEIWQGMKDPNKVVSFLAREAIDPLNYLPSAKAAKAAAVTAGSAGILATLMKFGTIAPSKSVSTGNQIGAFISRGAKTWNQPRYIEAVKMKVKGAKDEEIWNRTGTWLNTPDMIPRQEISDLNMRILNPNKWLKSTLPDMQGAYYQQGQLDTLVANPNLSAAYPGLLKGIFSKISKRSGDNKSGKFDSVGGRVFAHASKNEGILKVLAHELQHAVQSKEGFASGGNPAAIIKGDIPEAAAFFDAWRDKLLRAGQTPQNATDKAAYMAYYNLAGEAEARATAARLYYNDADRLTSPPWLDYDIIHVPLKDLILRFNKRTTP